jgi:hypothetical protein
MPWCFLLYMGLRIAIILVASVHQSSDFLWYYTEGISIAAGKGYWQDGVPTAYWPVGWPGLLGVLFRVFGPYAIVGKLANLVFAALTFLLTAALARRFLGDRLVARIAVLLLAVYPNQIAYIPALATEPFYEFLLLLAVWLLSKERLGWGLLAGLVFGVASLTKAQTPPLPVILLCGVWLLSKPRPGIAALVPRLAAVVGAMILVVVPWTIRNYEAFGAFVPISTNGGPTLLIGNNPDATGTDQEDVPMIEALDHGPRGQVANDKLAYAEAVHWIESHPLGFLELLPHKLWHMWAPDGEGEWLFEAGYPGFAAHKLAFLIVRIVNQAYYITLMALAAASLLFYTRGIGRKSPWAFSGWIVTAYFTAISLAFMGQSRFHYPLMPWIAIYAAIPLARWVGVKQAQAGLDPPTGNGRPPNDVLSAPQS